MSERAGTNRMQRRSGQAGDEKEGDSPGPRRQEKLSGKNTAGAAPAAPRHGGEAANRGGFLSTLMRRMRGGGATDLSPSLDDALDDGQREAVSRLPRARREMIERVIAFDEKRVDDVMAPRADILAVDIDTPLDALVRAFADAGHSRLPIYRGDLDDPVGMAHIKDVIALVADSSEEVGGQEGAGKESGGEQSTRRTDADDDEPILRRIRREVLYAPPSMRVTDLLLRMQASRIHMALVIDEYGGTDGLVTIEDLIEEIVGEINDEHDEDEAPLIAPRKNGGWEADARVELDAFAETAGVDLTPEDDEVDTLGGLVVSIAGRVPQRGEVLSHPAGFEFEVIAADPRKVRKILIQRKSARGRLRPAPANSAATGGESAKAAE